MADPVAAMAGRMAGEAMASICPALEVERQQAIVRHVQREAREFVARAQAAFEADGNSAAPPLAELLRPGGGTQDTAAALYFGRFISRMAAKCCRIATSTGATPASPNIPPGQHACSPRRGAAGAARPWRVGAHPRRPRELGPAGVARRLRGAAAAGRPGDGRAQLAGAAAGAWAWASVCAAQPGGRDVAGGEQVARALAVLRLARRGVGSVARPRLLRALPSRRPRHPLGLSEARGGGQPP